MKTLAFSLLFCMIVTASHVQSQNRVLSDADLYTLDGVKINASDLYRTDTLLVMVFWKSSDRKSFDQLVEISENYSEWINGKNVKVVGICTDQNGTASNVKPLVYAYDIGFEVYIDKNNDFRRAMNVPDIPYLILVDRNTELARFMGYHTDIAGFVNNSEDLRLAAVPGGK